MPSIPLYFDNMSSVTSGMRDAGSCVDLTASEYESAPQKWNQNINNIYEEMFNVTVM